jgi:TolA-binding protein
VRVVELHPEDLLDKDALGELEPADRARLDAHLEHCAVCRVERQLRADFADEFDAIGLDEHPSERSIGLGVVEQAAEIPPARESKVLLRSSSSRRRRKVAVWLLAAAAVLVGGVAAAAMGLTPAPWMRSASNVSVPDEAPVAQASHAKVHAAARAAAALGSSATDGANAANATAAATEVAETIAPDAVPVPLAPAPRPVGASTVVGPAELFDHETDARRHGDYARALDLGRQLEAHYPTSREAQVSRAVVGRLLLDRGDPAGALARFEGYLAAGSGQLGEEAMVGRATALDRLGRTDEATRAWGALVDAYPDTPYAAHAKARLETSIGH